MGFQYQCRTICCGSYNIKKWRQESYLGFEHS